MTTSERFAEEAEALLGSPFRHRGRNAAGIDCIGLTFAAAARAGVTIAPFIGYEPNPDPAVLLRAVRDRCDEAPWAERLLRGRLIVLRQKGGIEPKHFAVTLGNGMAAHVTQHRNSRARVVDEFVHSVWRVRGINYGDG